MPAFSTEQLTDVSGLLREVNSVELKVSVPEADQRAAIAALGIEPLEGHPREVVFFDTPELTLGKRGLVLRVERPQDRTATSVVRLRPVVPEQLPVLVRNSPNFRFELDVTSRGFVCSAAVTNQLDPATLTETVAGQRPLRKLFSSEQRSLYMAHAPFTLWFRKLQRLGPITVVEALLAPVEFTGRRFTAELWNYPDGSRSLELSMRCAPGQAFDVAAKSTAFLARHGVDVGAEHSAKTTRALEFFANEIKHSDAQGART